MKRLFLFAALFASGATVRAQTLNLPYSGNINSAQPAFSITNSGSGPAATFSGNVGVGTDTPQENLSVARALNVNQSDDNGPSLDHGLKFGQSDTGEGIASRRTPGVNRWGLDLYTNHVQRLTITNAGQVGVGTVAPSRTVEVHGRGDVELGLQSDDGGGRLWTIQSSGVTNGPLDSTFQIIDRSAGAGGVSRLAIDVQGTVSVGVLRITGGADVSEPFLISAQDSKPGSVVVIDERHPGNLKISRTAYDRKVVGVLSGANGLARGISLRQPGSDDAGMDVALVGRVYVMADAANGPITPGDLLTTSQNPGHAMRATDGRRSRGAVIGKAMTGLAKGQGFVLALINLQ